MKNILVTGSGGFIGSHLVEKLLEEPAINLRAFVRYNSFSSWGWLDAFPKDKIEKIEIFAGDIRDPNGVRKAVEGIDTIFHLAALIAIPYSYSSPDSYIDTNIKGTLNILQAARDNKVSRIYITSTSEVYGTAKYVPIDENHPRQGQSPYSASKIGADHLAESFFRSFDLPVTIIRPFNTFGPRQSARAVIPTIITQLLAGKSIIKLGDIDPTRDLLFVKDTVNGFLEIARSGKFVGEEVNIATGIEISIGDLANKIISLINPEATIQIEDIRMRPEKSEVKRLLGSNIKILSQTSWKPAYSLDEGLQETINWYKAENKFTTFKPSLYYI